jgi:hypothetical protein
MRFHAGSRKYGEVQHGKTAGPGPGWGFVLYGFGLVCGLLGISLNFSGSLHVGAWLIGVAITLTLSTALQLGHIRKR